MSWRKCKIKPYQGGSCPRTLSPAQRFRACCKLYGDCRKCGPPPIVNEKTPKRK